MVSTYCMCCQSLTSCRIFSSTHLATASASQSPAQRPATSMAMKNRRFRGPAARSHQVMVPHVAWSCTSCSRSVFAASAAFRWQTRWVTSPPGPPCCPSCSTAPSGPSTAASCCCSSFFAMRSWNAREATTSSGGPCITTRPSSSRITRSACRSFWGFGCITTMRVRPCMRGPISSSLQMCSPVGMSTEAKGSSMITTCARSW
mmetsp:Transcript_132359/g.411445  ORF Transcript_132359/g.411445 Transcript_132359/m.411445 type:complete len:203 (-) Transcript_132359:339-947(-)